MADVLKNFVRAVNDLYSRALPKIRKPIEVLFSLLIENQIYKKLVK